MTLTIDLRADDVADMMTAIGATTRHTQIQRHTHDYSMADADAMLSVPQRYGEEI
jgi:hypothetical protein